MPHYPGHIREAFEEWVDTGLPAVATLDVNYEPTEVPARRFLGILWNCSDILPGHVCRELDMPQGSTYAKAARALRAELEEADR